jgi:hypothetical protein
MEYCEYNTLHHCEHGYVIQCKNCGSYQVAFGNMMLKLMPEEYQAFKDYLQKQYKKGLTDEPQTKNIQIPTDSHRVAMIFSRQEAEKLLDLLLQAQLMQQVYESLNNKN